jgi:uncharacterized membrane protein YkoI
MKRLLIAAALAFGVASPALADHQGGHHDHGASHAAISQARALEVASAQGVTRVREIELRRGVWKVEGFTAAGRAIEVEIDAQSGAVVKRELQ